MLGKQMKQYSLLLLIISIISAPHIKSMEKEENDNSFLFRNIQYQPISLIPNNATRCIVAHGLGGTPDLWCNYTSDYNLAGIKGGWILDKSATIEKPRFDDCDEYGKFIPAKASLAQTSNIETLKKTLPAQNHYFYIGLSRGAAAVLTTLARLSIDEAKLCKGAVLESPPSNILHIIKEHLKPYIGESSATVGSIFLSPIVPFILPKYKLGGITPINEEVIKNLAQKQTPFFFMCSEEDNVVPNNCTKIIYFLLKDAGHEHCYLAQLQKGDHACLLIRNQTDEAKNCLYAIHAFYKKYGIEPYNNEWAQKVDLKDYQPEVPHELKRNEYFSSSSTISRSEW